MFGIIKKNYFLLISTFLILYFIFNFLAGERGIFSFVKKNNLLKNLQKEKSDLTNKIQVFEFKNSLLTDNIDLDFVETLIRKKFLFGKKDEIFYIINNNDD